LPVDEVKAYAEALKEAGILTGTLVGSATDMATASFKLQRGLTSLHEEMDGISKALVAGNEGTIEYTQALSSLKSILGDILNIDTSKLSADFLTNSDNIALLLQAANGNEDALMDYQQKAAENYLYTKYGVSRPTTQQLWGTNNLDFSSYKTGDTLSAEILDNFKERGLEGDALTDYLSVLGFTYDGTNAVYNGASTTAL
jgi:hypothetical protein